MYRIEPRFGARREPFTAKAYKLTEIRRGLDSLNDKVPTDSTLWTGEFAVEGLRSFFALRYRKFYPVKEPK